jgi:hypothetical protein
VKDLKLLSCGSETISNESGSDPQKVQDPVSDRTQNNIYSFSRTMILNVIKWHFKTEPVYRYRYLILVSSNGLNYYVTPSFDEFY